MLTILGAQHMSDWGRQWKSQGSVFEYRTAWLMIYLLRAQIKLNMKGLSWRIRLSFRVKFGGGGSKFFSINLESFVTQFESQKSHRLE